MTVKIPRKLQYKLMCLSRDIDSMHQTIVSTYSKKPDIQSLTTFGKYSFPV
jgi:hypothetical protein